MSNRDKPVINVQNCRLSVMLMLFIPFDIFIRYRSTVGSPLCAFIHPGSFDFVSRAYQ